MKKGSYTVEAALLMGVLIPLLVGMIYLGFFMMIRGNVQGEAIEKALTALLIGEETEGVSLVAKEVCVEAEAAVPALSLIHIWRRKMEWKRGRAGRGSWEKRPVRSFCFRCCSCLFW